MVGAQAASLPNGDPGARLSLIHCNILHPLSSLVMFGSFVL